jgi:hypothetical protein
MLDFPRRERFIDLVDEAVTRVSNLGGSREALLAPEFAKALSTLDSVAKAKSHQALVLSAARSHISRAEKQVVAQIIGDDTVYTQEMSELVRLRIICAEMMKILSTSLDRLKSSSSVYDD